MIRSRQFRPHLDRLEDRALMDAGFRSYDGSGNNLAHPDWGSTDVRLIRKAPSEYADGLSQPAGGDRPSAREISNVLVAHSDEETKSDRQLSAYIYIWGQFLDHDLDLTQPPDTGGEAFDIPVPTGDQFFDPGGAGGQFIFLTRSRYDLNTGTTRPRQQINQITAFIDASMVYGSDEATADRP